MDTREKLIELLNGVLTTEDVTTSKEVADHLISHGVTVQEWISVKDRLPEDNERVLVYHDDGMIRFGINKGGFADVVSTAYLQNHHSTCFSKVTHWMPLPQPPKGE